MRNGERCSRNPFVGLSICSIHAENNNLAMKKHEDHMKAIRLRLAEDTTMALETLEELNRFATGEAVRLKAATEILDRAGVRGGIEIEVEHSIKEDTASLVAERLARIRETTERTQHLIPTADDPSLPITDGELVPEASDEAS